jgi:hypothetical protein
MAYKTPFDFVNGLLNDDVTILFKANGLLRQ